MRDVLCASGREREKDTSRVCLSVIVWAFLGQEKECTSCVMSVMSLVNGIMQICPLFHFLNIFFGRSPKSKIKYRRHACIGPIQINLDFLLSRSAGSNLGKNFGFFWVRALDKKLCTVYLET